MKILALNPGHDAGIAYVVDRELVFSFEAEKDSHPRHSSTTAELLLEASAHASAGVDVVAIGGWHRLLPGEVGASFGGYWGVEPGRTSRTSFFGSPCWFYESSHERSHIFGSIGLSAIPDDAVLLVWEGVIGAFYRWRGAGVPIDRYPVLSEPGARYAGLFALSDPTFPDFGAFPPSEDAGKLMALAGCADDEPPAHLSMRLVGSLLGRRSLYPFDKGRYRRSPLYNCGPQSVELRRTARYLTWKLFDKFQRAAVELFEPGLPLVISGGCGLNCAWNTAWRSLGHFSEVFVPPCTDDSGSAIGTAIDAQSVLGGGHRIKWDVYSGAAFRHDVDPEDHGWHRVAMEFSALAKVLDEGEVVTWVSGRSEIGPRALGNRSLLASARRPESRTRLNEIKQREPYRPIAPVCLEAELAQWFDTATADPYMLFFGHVRRPDLIPAITHEDGTARIQSVTPHSNPALHDLLMACRERTGVAVLCNTSLNFKGRGFINRTSDLLTFCRDRRIRHAVIEREWFVHSNEEQLRATN